MRKTESITDVARQILERTKKNFREKNPKTSKKIKINTKLKILFFLRICTYPTTLQFVVLINSRTKT